jgi:hypothetical protein
MVGSRNKEFWEKPFESFFSNLLNLAPILGRLKSSIPHGVWRFHIFPIFLLNLEYTFISTEDFTSWKSEFTKNSSRFACVMEIFCTLLQCKVHLSMFHSSPTSKDLVHKYLTWCTLKWCKSSKLCSSKILHQRWSNSVAPARSNGTKLFFPLQTL